MPKILTQSNSKKHRKLAIEDCQRAVLYGGLSFFERLTLIIAYGRIAVKKINISETRVILNCRVAYRHVEQERSAADHSNSDERKPEIYWYFIPY